MFQIQSFFVYTLLAILMFVLAKKAEDSYKFYNWLPIICFTIIIGLRYSVGVDWENYRAIYEEELKYMSFAQMLETLEF